MFSQLYYHYRRHDSHLCCCLKAISIVYGKRNTFSCMLWRDKNQAAPESLVAVRLATELSIIVAVDEWEESLLFHMCFRTFLPIPVVFLTTSGHMHMCDSHFLMR